MNTATKDLLVGGLVSAVGAVAGGALGYWLGDLVAKDFGDDKDDRRKAETIGMLAGVAVGAGISGGISAWRTGKEIASNTGAAGELGAAEDVADVVNRLLGAGLLLKDGDYPIPDPLHPECTITLHCTRDANGRQHCTSTKTCP